MEQLDGLERELGPEEKADLLSLGKKRKWGNLLGLAKECITVAVDDGTAEDQDELYKALSKYLNNKTNPQAPSSLLSRVTAPPKKKGGKQTAAKKAAIPGGGARKKRKTKAAAAAATATAATAAPAVPTAPAAAAAAPAPAPAAAAAPAPAAAAAAPAAAPAAPAAPAPATAVAPPAVAPVDGAGPAAANEVAPEQANPESLAARLEKRLAADYVRQMQQLDQISEDEWIKISHIIQVNHQTKVSNLVWIHNNRRVYNKADVEGCDVLHRACTFRRHFWKEGNDVVQG